MSCLISGKMTVKVKKKKKKIGGISDGTVSPIEAPTDCLALDCALSIANLQS